MSKIDMSAPEAMVARIVAHENLAVFSGPDPRMEVVEGVPAVVLTRRGLLRPSPAVHPVQPTGSSPAARQPKRPDERARATGIAADNAPLWTRLVYRAMSVALRHTFPARTGIVKSHNETRGPPCARGDIRCPWMTI